MSEEIKIRGVKRILKKELLPFTKQLAAMNGAGMSILTVIQTLDEQCADPEFKKVIRELLRTIESGDSLSRGLMRFPRIFDRMYVNMAVAGEQSGEFAGVLRRLAGLLQSSYRLRRKIRSALAYPAVVLSIALVISWGLIQFVVPTFAEVFASSGMKLPGLTQALVDLAAFGNRWWFLILPSVVGLVWLFLWWRRTESGRWCLDEWALKIPVFGPLNHKAAVARLARLLAQMLASGVPILRSLEVVAGAVGNHVIEISLGLARKEVEQGTLLATALDGKPYMPIALVRMVAAGERAGRVEEMLESIADNYDEEVETLLGTLTTLMEPFLMVVLGVIIGTIVVAMFLPVFNLGSLVHA